MKTELIEYHREQARFWQNRTGRSKEAIKAQEAFHERAVAWLEGNPESNVLLGPSAGCAINEREPKVYSKA